MESKYRELKSEIRQKGVLSTSILLIKSKYILYLGIFLSLFMVTGLCKCIACLITDL